MMECDTDSSSDVAVASDCSSFVVGHDAKVVADVSAATQHPVEVSSSLALTQALAQGVTFEEEAAVAQALETALLEKQRVMRHLESAVLHKQQHRRHATRAQRAAGWRKLSSKEALSSSLRRTTCGDATGADLGLCGGSAQASPMTDLFLMAEPPRCIYTPAFLYVDVNAAYADSCFLDRQAFVPLQLSVLDVTPLALDFSPEAVGGVYERALQGAVVQVVNARIFRNRTEMVVDFLLWMEFETEAAKPQSLDNDVDGHQEVVSAPSTLPAVRVPVLVQYLELNCKVLGPAEDLRVVSPAPSPRAAPVSAPDAAVPFPM